MKKHNILYLFMVIIMIPYLVGCNDDEVTTPIVEVEEEAIPITFSTGSYPGVSLDDGTRATITNDEASIVNMGVYTYLISTDVDGYVANPESYVLQDDDNIMTNRIVERSTSDAGVDTWSYLPIEYWDTADDHALYFIAYTPYAEGLVILNDDFNTEEGNGISSYQINDHIYINYSMPESVELQPSIMVSDPIVKRYDSTANTQESISFAFNHAVAAVGIKIDGNSSKKLVAAGIVGLYDTGSLVMGEDTNAWSELRSSDSDEIYLMGLADDTKPYSTTDANYTIEPRNITADDGYLMVIPQSMNNDTKLVISYCDADYTVPDNYEIIKTNEWSSSSEYSEYITKVEYYLSGSRGWYAGYRYYYNVTLP